ncbi:MAG TPA: septum formation inhibitor Maf [Gammaproteobacteria bacterium]|nr:septum formation inhibitor Maf [Gammaproteobacteria bacterium]
MRKLVLASTSPYRRALLARLQLPFETACPEVDETPLPSEPPEQLVARLAELKARAVAPRFPDALIIGSDQLAVRGGKTLGKPGGFDAAKAQLLAASGKTVRFLTGLCLLDSPTGQAQVTVVPYSVVFRALDEAQIERYLHREQPYHCAGAFKSEGLGIALFKQMEGTDPNALVGLPLIKLISMLECAGVHVL